MILSFRCSPRLKQKVDRLIEKGLYSDFSAFCEVALENQLLLEESGSEGRGSLRPQPPAPHGHGGSRTRRKNVAETPEGPQIIESVPTNSVLTGQTTTNGFPEDLLRERTDANAPFALPDPSPDLFGPGQSVPVDRWLFGQYNRLLPAKVSVRALCVIASAEGKDSLKLESASARIAEIAATFGDHLRRLDSNSGAHRDDALSTAFPEAGADGQKGRVRYQNHFVGHTIKGEQGGLLVGLKLAVIQVVKNKPCILPTKAGWNLALLENPILDHGTPGTGRFTLAERDFLLQHVRSFVPAERFAYSVILEMLLRGVVSPEAMTTELFKLLSPGRKSEEAKEFVNTQRSGVLGRMTDLGLIVHDRNGRNVNRVITPKGESFFGAIKNVSLVAAS